MKINLVCEGGGIKGFRKAALSAGMQGAFGSALNAGLKGFDNTSSNVRANSWYAQNIAMRNQMNDVKSTHGLGKYNKYNGELVINEEDKKISISIILNILYDK